MTTEVKEFTMKKILLLLVALLTLSGCYELPDLEVSDLIQEDVIYEDIMREDVITEDVISEDIMREDVIVEFESKYIRDNVLDLETTPDSVGAITLGQSGPRVIAYSNSNEFTIGRVDVFYETYNNNYEVFTVSETGLTEWLTLDVNISDYAVIGVIVYDPDGLLLGWGYQQIIGG